MVQVDKSAGDGSLPGSASRPVLPQRAGSLLIRELIDLYMAHYAGRDPTRVQRQAWTSCSASCQWPPCADAGRRRRVLQDDLTKENPEPPIADTARVRRA